MATQHYGTLFRWSTVGAPKPCGCILDGYTYKETQQEHMEQDEAGDHAMLKLHGKTGDISFSGIIDDTSVDLPDLSVGAKVEFDSPDTTDGTVLCSDLTEEWAIGVSKKFDGRATHFPDCVGGAGASAGSLDGFTPSQILSPVIRPADKCVWSTAGMTSVLGIVQRLRIQQSLTLSPEPNEHGKIVAVAATGYIRRITAEILALSTATRPATDTVLSIVGAPDHAAQAVIKDSEIRWTKGRRALFAVEAVWIPAMAA